jgi:hypothetical protein
MCRSTRFDRLHAHHQEPTAALTASGFTLERGGSSVVGCWSTNNAATTNAPTVEPEAVNAVVSS